MVKEDDLNKFIALEQRMRAFEGIHLYDPIKAVEMCLVPNAVIPKILECQNLLNIRELNALISKHTATKWLRWLMMRNC
jgi:hypothetical protein